MTQNDVTMTQNDVTMIHRSQIDKALVSHPGLPKHLSTYEANKAHGRLTYRQINRYMRQLIDKQTNEIIDVQSDIYTRKN